MKLFVNIFFAVFFWHATLIAQHKVITYEPHRSYNNQQVSDLINMPEENIDIGLWSLIIAKEFDPSTDVNAGLQMLSEMSEEIIRMLAGRDTDLDKLLAVKTFLYENGTWNNFRSFEYDLSDPLGKVLANQLLSTYLTTHKGNCVSMPTLFLALMERVDPNVRTNGVESPLHLFCRFKDRQTGDIWNIETTNGGKPVRNQFYIDKSDITKKAIETGIYLRDLSKKEYLAGLINVLTLKERKNQNYSKALEYAELALKLNSRCVTAVVQKGALLGWLGYEFVEQKKTKDGYKSISEMPEKDRKKAKWFDEQSKKHIQSAYDLGWQPESEEQRDSYINEVKTQKEKSKN